MSAVPILIIFRIILLILVNYSEELVSLPVRKMLAPFIPFHNYVRGLEQKLFWSSRKRRFLVLDAGCGEGSFCSKAFPSGDVVGIDLDASELRKSRQRFRVLCDLHYLPLRNGVFNTVVCNSVLEHCSPLSPVLAEFHRVSEHRAELFFDLPIPQKSRVLNRISETVFKYRYSSIIAVKHELNRLGYEIFREEEYGSSVFHRIYVYSSLFPPLLLLSHIYVTLLRRLEGQVSNKVCVFIGAVKR